LANGRPAAALAALKQAIALDQQWGPAHRHLGIALQELGRLEEAESAYREALRIDPADAASYLNLGELLHARGHYPQAQQCFVSALRIRPTLNQARLRLADTLVELEHLEAAASCYRDIIATSPAPGAIYMQLGRVLWKLGDSSGALDAFERLAIANPLSAAAHYNLGSAQLELERFDAAVLSAQQALRLRPGFAPAATLYAAGLAATGELDAGLEVLRQSEPEQTAARRSLDLAIRLLSSRLFDPARRCLERVLREQPGEAMASHLLAALSGANPAHPIEGYVRQLFDASAATFDQELVAKLGYGIPREMVEALRALECAPPGPWDALDLGCGTGLVGMEIAACSRCLTGIDLAPNMIERARDRKLYTQLHCEDLLAALVREEERQHQYDVVTAADVFIYVGKLDPVIAAIRRVLRPGGLLAFSAEALEAADAVESTSVAGGGEGYRLGMMGRYAHSADYIRSLAAQNGFEVHLLRPTRIRFEHRRPVKGWLTVWRA